jgi:hypothetical protein
MALKAKKRVLVAVESRPATTTDLLEAKAQFPTGKEVKVHGRIATVGGIEAWMDPIEGTVIDWSAQGHLMVRTVGGVRSVRRTDIVKDGEKQRQNPPSGFKEANVAKNAKVRKEKVAKTRAKRTWGDGTQVPANGTTEFLDRAVAELEKGNILFPAASKRGGRILVKFAAKWLARLADAKKVEVTEEWVKATLLKEFKPNADHAGMRYIAEGLVETPSYIAAVVKQTRKFAGVKAERKEVVRKQKVEKAKELKGKTPAKKGKKAKKSEAITAPIVPMKKVKKAKKVTPAKAKMDAALALAADEAVDALDAAAEADDEGADQGTDDTDGTEVQS